MTPPADARVAVLLAESKDLLLIKSDRTKYPAFSLGWIYDEIFLKREIYEAIFAPLGIGSWPVLIHSTERESASVVQLDLPECDWDFDMTGMPFEICSECHGKKYSVRPLDFLPPLNGDPPGYIFRGREFYGSGAQADQRIYLTQDLREKLLELKIAKWFQYYPLKP